MPIWCSLPCRTLSRPPSTSRSAPCAFTTSETDSPACSTRARLPSLSCPSRQAPGEREAQVHLTLFKGHSIYEDYSDDRNFDDGGSIAIGSVCPFSRLGSSGGAEAHQFTATLYYRNPFGQNDDLEYGAIGQDVNIGAGLSLGAETVWSTVEKYKYDENLQKKTMGILYSSEAAKEPPFMSLYPIMDSGRRSTEFRAHEGFFVQTIVKLPPQSQGQYKLHYWESGSNDSSAYSEVVRPCKVEVVHVGGNLPCMAIPEFDVGSPRDTIRIEMPHEASNLMGNGFDRRCGYDAAAYFDVSYILYFPRIVRILKHAIFYQSPCFRVPRTMAAVPSYLT